MGNYKDQGQASRDQGGLRARREKNTPLRGRKRKPKGKAWGLVTKGTGQVNQERKGKPGWGLGTGVTGKTIEECDRQMETMKNTQIIKVTYI